MKARTLNSLLEIPSHSGSCEGIYNWVVELCNEQGWDALADQLGNVYVTKGKAETYPCVVAHMDTVHRIEKGGIHPIEINGYITGFNPLTMRQTGIGGDDKCGVWAAAHCLETLEACKAVFFVDEETGCRGSRGCDLEFFKDCRFILQADRRGWKDFVNSIGGAISSKEFQNDVEPIMKKYKYAFCSGMMTDVEALTDREVGISSANMSAGYYQPHSDGEFISIEDLNKVCDMMVEICEIMTKRYPFIQKKPKWSFGGQSGGGSRSYGSGNNNHSHPRTGMHSDYDGSEYWSHFKDDKSKTGVPDYDPSKKAHGPDQMDFERAVQTRTALAVDEHCTVCGNPIGVNEIISGEPETTCVDCAIEMYARLQSGGGPESRGPTKRKYKKIVKYTRKTLFRKMRERNS